MRRLFLLCAFLAACGDDSVERDVQLVVAVTADAPVVTQLGRIEARLFAGSGGAPSVQRFALGTGANATRFPFSFVIEQAAGSHARLELVGFDRSDAAAIEHKTIVGFDEGAATLTVRLRAGCLQHVCESEQETCSLGAAGATCAPLADVSDFADAGYEVVDGDIVGLDASLDAGPDADTSVRAPDASSDAELPPEPLASCPADNACSFDEYACLVSDDGAGYSCRGQYAAWPMPDSTPGAKVAPRYSLIGDEMVLDEITGLAWQRKPPATYDGCKGRIGSQAGDSCSWNEAIHYCEQLSLGGQRWRLPSRIELESLYDFTQKPVAINTTFFPGTSSLSYWSITKDAVPQFAGNAFLVSYRLGWSSGDPYASAAPVRCVRSQRAPNAPPNKRFSRTKGRVLDAFTTLEWTDVISRSAFTTVEAAEASCAGIGMRLPTYKEVLTLADFTREVASDPEYFPSYVSEGNWFLWTPSKFASGEPIVYAVQLGIGVELSLATENDIEVHARCVH